MIRSRRAASWTCLTALAVLLGACGPRDVQAPDALAGHWEGSVAYRDATLPVDLDIEVRAGAPVARLTVPGLLLRDVPAEAFAYRSPKLQFRFPVGGETWKFDGWFRRNMVVGTFSGGSLPRTFNRGQLPQLGLRRVKRKPDPYTADTVRFAGGASRLAGTVYVPADSDTVALPGVLLLHPDGDGTREASPELAERFARQGFAVLAFDTRGRGASAGAPATAASDLEFDASEALEFLRRHPAVDPARVGVCGGSLGAVLVPRVALRVHPAFAVALSPPAEPLARGRGEVPEWARAERDADPVASWAAVRAPALVLLGERDEVQASEPAAKRFAAALAAEGHAAVRVDRVPRADHALRVKTAFGEAYDFPRAAPGGLDTLFAWTRRRVGLAPLPPPLVPPMR